ncbi:MAG: hypothetical protein HY033_09650 [Ignavibacteriae bacterium]|nr:hypothetical protein [Ignavibacteriota bacterium]
MRNVVQVLVENDIQYMITGSMVSSMQGEPRSTHDIDIVVAISKSAARQLAEAFPPPRFHLDEASIVSAIESRSMFNLIDSDEGDKVDFWTLMDTPFDRSRFARRVTEKLFGSVLHVSAPEDTILAKLAWVKKSGGSEKHFTDALRVYEVQHDALDKNYLGEWVTTLHVADIWKRLLEEAELP